MIDISNTIQHVMDKATAKEGLLVITLYETHIVSPVTKADIRITGSLRG